MLKLKQSYNKMCGEEKVMTLVQLAKKQENVRPEEAAKNYLEAAEIILQQSYNHPNKEKEYIEVANKMFLKAKKLKSLPPGKLVSRSENKITFKDIGGLEELKEEISFKIIEPFNNPDLFKYYGKQAGGGILMYGPPGCGKSLIAMATANEANVNFIHVKSSDLKSKFVGETEKNIAELFQQARDAQPTIIFFDEFESLGADRSESHAHEKNMVAQLLTEMDGMGAKDQQILLLAATNEPWSIDPALRREGRFGSTIFIPPPDLKAKEHILKLQMKKRPTENLDYSKLAELSQGFSGADLKSVCEIATNIPLKESMRTKKRRKINMQDMETGIENISSIMKQWFVKAKTLVMMKKMEELFPELLVHAKEHVTV